jgi:hypothetical protein
VEEEIAQLQSNLKTFKPHTGGQLFLVAAWCVVIMVLVGFAASEAMTWMGTRRPLTALLKSIVLPLGGVYFGFTKATFTWNTPKRQAWKQVEIECWNAHHDRKAKAAEQELAGVLPGESPLPPAPAPPPPAKESGGGG